ncbi:MAG: aminotransferase class V-fold PLP-dependent enzyme [Pseudomonadota bacterium]
MMTITDRNQAEAADETDPLRKARRHFKIPAGVIYLDGNSLGPPPRSALDRLQTAADNEWRNGLIRSWNDACWIDLPAVCGKRIAALIGVEPDDVLVADSVSTNIFKLAGALWRQKGGAIAVSDDEFPTDGYILQGLSGLTGAKLISFNEQDDPFQDQTVKILVKSAAHYKTAAIADIEQWERRACAADAAIIWDLSHATGVLDLRLKNAGAAFAVGCGYKYLNGGPGAPAFVYAAKDQANALEQPLSGWMGHAAPFDFAQPYRPADGVRRFACGTPPILSLSALAGALEIFDQLDLAALEAKARALGDLFLARTERMGLTSVSPGAGQPRGGHVSVKFENGYAVVQALIAHGVIGDFRAPDLMRFGFSPLFLRYADVWDAADILENVLTSEEWRKPEFRKKQTVT